MAELALNLDRNVLTIGEILTSTLKNYSNDIVNNVIGNNVLLTKIKEKGNLTKESGGILFEHKISYNSNSTFQWQGQSDILNTTTQRVLDSAQYSIKIATGTAKITQLESDQNSGKQQLFNLMEARKNNLIDTFSNNLGSAVYGDGTANSGQAIGGLQLLIADNPTTGTVGGIDRSANTFWRNQVWSFSSDGSTTASNSTIQNGMNQLYLRCSKVANELPNLGIADPNYFSFYENSLQSIQRITTSSDGQLGYQTYMYKNLPLYMDPNCVANHIYFINTKYIFLKYIGESFVQILPSQRAINQLEYITPALFQGNMTMSQARVHGVLKA